jgi:hypothetical protein
MRASVSGVWGAQERRPNRESGEKRELATEDAGDTEKRNHEINKI